MDGPSSTPMDPADMATSSPSRPKTSHRSGTPSRSRVSRQGRLNTAMTTTSSVGELPEQSFFPDNDDDEFDDVEGEYYSDEEDGDVFAFERPKTAAVLTGQRDLHSENRTGTSGSLASALVGSRSAGRTTTSASQGRGVTFGFSVHDHPEPLASNVSSPGLDNLTQLDYQGSSDDPPAMSQNINAPAYTQPSYWPAQRPSAVSSTLVGRPSTARTRNSQRFSAFPDDSVASASEYSAFNQDVRRHRDDADEIELSAYRKKGEDRHARPDTRTTRASWNISELQGAETIPDGETTKGDGKGGLHPKWAIDDVQSSAGVPGMEDIEEDSPYPEVRASVSNIDDPEMPVLTFRSGLIGLLFVIVGSAFNTFFTFRGPGPTFLPLAAQVVAYPVGRLMAWAMPLYIVRFPTWLGGVQLDLNPGPFNIKEHTVITIMANVSFVTMSGLHVATAAQVYLEGQYSDSFALLLTMAAQMGGFGLAGIGRRFLVWPASMIWPYNLVITTNLNTLHAGHEPGTGRISRIMFFNIALVTTFVYHFFPGYVMTCLSYFSWICWIKPDNVVVNQLFGVSSGLGMGILTFDWSQILAAGNPLTIPWWAQANIGASFVFFFWIIAPILYYTNVWNASYLPIISSGLFDRYGSYYNTSRVVSPDHQLDIAEYLNYSPVYLSMSYCLVFTLAFALTTAAVVHTVLHQGPRMYKTVRHGRAEEDDIHMKLMRQYPEVPDWWFAVILITTFIFGVIAIEVNDTGVPVYALLVAMLVTLVYYFPAGFLFARAASSLAINLIAELIPGYMLEGSILGNMVAKSYAIQTLFGACQFTQDQKLGHYMKIPPRITFIVQIVAASVACIVSFAVKRMLFALVDDICSPTQADQFTCPFTRVYYNSGVLWGAIGPRRLFSRGSLYWPQTFAAIGGAVLPIPLWWIGRRYPKRWFSQIDLVVIFNGVLGIPPATGVNYASCLLVGFIFQYVIRHRNFGWWSKYTYVLAAALEVGTLLTFIVIFLGMGLTGTRLDWSGNTIYTKTADWFGLPYRTPPVEGFGPASGWQ